MHALLHANALLADYSVLARRVKPDEDIHRGSRVNE